MRIAFSIGERPAQGLEPLLEEQVLIRGTRAATILAAACVVVVACGGQTASTSSGGDKPAGADRTQIKDWSDPRPSAWTKKYPLFAPSALGDGSLKRVQDAGVLTHCAELDYSPYDFVDPKTQEIRGFEIDMFNYVGKVLGVSNVKHVNINWQSMIPGVQAGTCDIGAQGLAIRSDRAGAPGIKFSVPYMALFDVISVRKDSSINQLSDLKGKKVATIAGSTDELSLKALIDSQLGGPNVTKLVTFNGASECYIATVNRTVDACVMDLTIANPNTGMLSQYTQLHIVGPPIPYVPSNANEPKLNPYVFGSCGAVLRAVDGDLNRAFSIALNMWISSGQQQKVMDKWGIWNGSQSQLVRQDA